MGRPSRARFAQQLLLLLVLAVVLTGCAAHKTPIATTNDTMPAGETSSADADAFALEEEFAEERANPPLDPLSGYNRVMTQVNDKAYFWVLKPVATGYRAVLPEGLRLAVGRFFRNLLMPVNVANNLLQLKPKRAATELARFAVNTTVGFFGFTDPAASELNLQPYPEDFGQTLGHYGVGGGFHIVLPLLGPSNLRDTLGLVPDYYLDPVSHIDDFETRIAIRATKQVNQTSLHIGEYESIKKDAVDLYTFLRDGYEQRRDKLIEE